MLDGMPVLREILFQGALSVAGNGEWPLAFCLVA